MRRFFALTIFLLHATYHFAQPIETLVVDELTEYLELRPQEKVFLHTNKQILAAGETLWFKAYLTDANTLKASKLSKVLNVELIDQNQRILYSRVLKLENGSGFAEIDLSDSLPDGDYFLKAYTNYMLNFDRSLLYTQPLKIINKWVAYPKAEDPPTAFDVQFFPESGYLVSGLITSVGFKAINEKGLGVSISGEIVDDQANKITDFQSQFAGMGSFKLIPTIEHMYTARVSYQGSVFEFPLPAVRPSGAIIQVTPALEKMTLKVLTKDYSLENHFLLGYQRGKAVMLLKPDPTNSYMYSAFSTTDLPTGIVHFTLFNPEGIAIAERLSFIMSQNDPTLSIENIEKNANRSKTSVSLSMDHLGEDNGLADLSVSVFKASLDLPMKNTIQTHLLLSSDLKGHIEMPQYYFADVDMEKVEALNNLLLTQGWRRFKWATVMNKDLPEIQHFLEQHQSISGQLFKYYNRQHSAPGNVSLTVLENPLINATVETGEDGRFQFAGLDFQDTVSIILQAQKPGKKAKKDPTKEKNDAYYIKVNQRKSPPVVIPLVPIPEAEMDGAISDAEAQMNRIREIEAAFSEGGAIMLDAFEFKSSKNPYDDPVSSRALMYNNPTTRVELDSMPVDPRLGAASMADVFNALQIPGFNTTTMQSRGASTFSGSNTVAFFYDGMQVDKEFVMQDLSPSDVGSIDYFTGAKASIFGAVGASGVIAIYPRSEQSYANLDVVGIANFKLPGYYQPREFYSPNYDVITEEKPDYRATLYWNPAVQTDQNGTATFSFFTSDEDAEYLIEVQGLTSDGSPVFRQSYLIME